MREKGLSCVPKCEYRFPVNGISQMNAEWTGLEFAKSQRVVEKREKRRKLVAKPSVVPQRPSWLRGR